MKKIAIMECWARSGGTILHRCLSLLPNTIAYSEVNSVVVCPTKCPTIKDQSREWYGIDLHSETFEGQVREVVNNPSTQNHHIIIRDWSYGSFVPLSFNNFQPENNLGTLQCLKKICKCKSFAFVRNAKDIWLSMSVSEKEFHDIKLEHLLCYTKQIIMSGMPIFKYEDFCENPELVMRSICQYLEMEYSNTFLHFYENYKTTGDIDTVKISRGSPLHKISILPRRDISDEKSVLLELSYADEVNALLGYE